MGSVLLIARVVLAAVFATAGAAKLADRAGSRQAAADFGVPARLAGFVGLALPIVELAVAVAMLPLASAVWAAAAALALLLTFSGAIAVNLARGRAPDCHCFGQLHSAPAGWSTLARNGALAAVAGVVVAAGVSGEAGASALTSIEQLGALEGSLIVAVGGALVAAWLGLRWRRENRRLRERLRRLERQGPPAAVGAPAPGFSLPSASGGDTSLADLLRRGKPVLLVFTDPRCGPCHALLPHVARWQSVHAGEVTAAVVTGGDLADAREQEAEYALELVLSDAEHDVFDRFGVTATPSAVLVGADGSLQTLAEGGDAIHALLADRIGARPLPAPAREAARVPHAVGASAAGNSVFGRMASRRRAVQLGAGVVLAGVFSRSAAAGRRQAECLPDAFPCKENLCCRNRIHVCCPHDPLHPCCDTRTSVCEDKCRDRCPEGWTPCGKGEAAGKTGCCNDLVEECVGGKCATKCPPGSSRCGTSCCGRGQKCDHGRCVARCKKNQKLCGKNCCNAGEICQKGKCLPKCKKDEERCGDECCPKLLAVPGGPYKAVRGGRVRLNGSRSKGRIKSYKWTFSQGACSKVTLKAGARKEGKTVEVQVLCSVKVTLTVSDGKRTDAKSTTIEISERKWKRPVKHVGERIWATVGMNALLLQLGRNVCALDGPAAEESGHFIHPGDFTEQYELAEVDDPDGPYDGKWYVRAWNGRVERVSLINRDFFPNHEVYDMNMQQNRADFELLARSVRSHERFHTDLLAEAWKKDDPGAKLDALAADTENEATAAVVSILSAAEERLGRATSETAVKTKMRAVYGTRTAKLLLPDPSTGTWKTIQLGPVASLGDDVTPG